MDEVFKSLGLQFKPNEVQRKAMNSVLNEKNRFTFITQATGSGKSMTFLAYPAARKQILKDLEPCIVVVICPLVSVIENHLEEAAKLGISACRIGDDLPGLYNNEYQLAFGNAEAWLEVKENREFLDPSRSQIKLAVLDEVHVIPSWGVNRDKKKEKAFRTAFGRLGELKSLLPPETPFLALTATATKGTKKDILSLFNLPVTEIYEHPYRHNIKLLIQNLKDGKNVHEACHWIAKRLRNEKEKCDRIVIYCRSLVDCGLVFRYFLSSLGDNSYINETNEPSKRLFGMYHHCTPNERKAEILSALRDPQSACRVIIATTALGMGVNMRDVSIVVFFGVPHSLQDFVQQVGRAGRDGSPANAILYTTPYSKGKSTKLMKSVIKSEGCLRQAVLDPFVNNNVKVESVAPLHFCCSNCAVKCKCAGNSCTRPVPDFESVPNVIITKPKFEREVEEGDLEVLKKCLLEAKEQFSNTSSSLLPSHGMFSDDLIEQCISNAKYIFNATYIIDKLPVIATDHIKAILLAFAETFEDDTVNLAVDTDTCNELLSVDFAQAFATYDIETETLHNEDDYFEACDEFLFSL